jgi:hypothetical protein
VILFIGLDGLGSFSGIDKILGKWGAGLVCCDSICAALILPYIRLTLAEGRIILPGAVIVTHLGSIGGSRQTAVTSNVRLAS